MGTALSREEYMDLVCGGEALEYPKSTVDAMLELRFRGYDAGVPTLTYLAKQGKVTPDRDGVRNFAWREQHIDQAAELLHAAGELTPLTLGCLALGVTYGAYSRSLREAVRQVQAKYGAGCIGEDADLFVTHFYPPSRTEPGRVEFTLCDDVAAVLQSRRRSLRSSNPQASSTGRAAV